MTGVRGPLVVFALLLACGSNGRGGGDTAGGRVFAILGTGSGFEGVTTLFYDSVSITLTPAN